MKKTFKEYIEESKDLTEARTYLLLPKKVIGNELFEAQRQLTEIYKSMKAGSDFKLQDMDDLIDQLIKVKNSSKEFKVGEKPTGEYA